MMALTARQNVLNGYSAARYSCGKFVGKRLNVGWNRMVMAGGPL